MRPGQDKPGRPGPGKSRIYAFVYRGKEKRGVFKAVLHKKNCTAGGILAALVLNEADHGMENLRCPGPDKDVIRIPFQKPVFAVARWRQNNYRQAGAKALEMLYRDSCFVIQGLHFNKNEVKICLAEQCGSLFHRNSVGDLPGRWVNIRFESRQLVRRRNKEDIPDLNTRGV